ncbi:MAG TPA: flagellar basal body P-ring formation chaperone FlgA [Stellaceae bacterium]|nr:flagellar basal body P-ring formation chaperone FlgA [Stellaceae bacterium]
MARLVVVLAALLFAFSAARAAPMLRPAITVSGPVIHLGDIFADAGQRADDAVAAAPGPGMRMTLPSDWLAAMAREHGLDWTPRSGYDQTVVERASRSIAADRIAHEILGEIGARQRVDDAEILLDNPGLALVVAAEAADTIAINGLVIDQRSGRFSAIVSAPAGDPSAPRQRITGRLVYRIAVPVLTRALAPGATIGADDVETVTMRRDHIGPDVATDATQLLGRTPRRQLSAGTPVRLADVQRPILVHKGDLVTMVLDTGTMQLTAQGKALDDGARDALVRVANTKSSRVVDAAVTGPGTVAASLPGAARLDRTALR